MIPQKCCLPPSMICGGLQPPRPLTMGYKEKYELVVELEWVNEEQQE